MRCFIPFSENGLAMGFSVSLLRPSEEIIVSFGSCDTRDIFALTVCSHLNIAILLILCVVSETDGDKRAKLR